MTVELAPSRWSYIGNGATTGFAYTSRIFADSDLKVFIDGTLKTLVSDYSVTGAGSAGGGNVVLLNAPASGGAVVIIRDVAATQGLDLASLGSFPAEENEKALDRLTVLAQQLEDAGERVLRQPDGDTANILPLPVKALRAGKVLGFDADGSPVVSSSSLASVDSILDSAAAQTTLATTQAGIATARAGEAATSAAAATASALAASDSADAAAASAIEAAEIAAGANGQVKINANDTTPGLLGAKLVAGTGLSLSENNDGGNETLTVACTVSSAPVVSPQTSGSFSAGSTTDNTLYVVSSQGAACTLPATSAVATGFRVRLKNQSDGLSVTLVRAGSDTIDGETNLRVPGRSEIEVARTGAGEWTITRSPPHLVGEVIEWTKDSLPAGGWSWCNGTAISRTTYQGLFNEVGTTFGAGDGSTTFNTPDRRGRVAAGKDDMGGASAANRLTTGGSGVSGTTLGAAGGLQTHTLTIAEMPAHNHDLKGSTANADAVWASNRYFGVGIPYTETHLPYMSSTTNNDNNVAMANTGSGGAHNNTQPTIVANFIVKT